MNLLFFLKPKQEVCTLHKNFTLRQGVEKLRQGGFSSVPVIDEEGKYCGTVSEGVFSVGDNPYSRICGNCAGRAYR